MASILQNLDSKNVLNSENKNVKKHSDSKFKKNKRIQEDRVNTILRNDIRNKKDDEPLDPYSKEKSTSEPSKSKVLSLTNSTYQNTLLEKLLQSQNNPDMLESELKFREKTVSLLTELRDIMKDNFTSKEAVQRQEEDIEYKREMSSLAKNIATLNTGGVMNDLRKGITGSIDKYGMVDMAMTMKDVIKETLSSGAIGDMIKDSLQDSVLGLLGNKNKTTIKSFKEDPVSAIQDFINTGSMSNNKAVRALLSPFFKGLKADPIVKSKNKDLSAVALFDNRSHTTLNVVLPDILTKIQAVLEKGEQRKFNYEEDKWETMGQIIEQQIGKDSMSKYTTDVIDYLKTSIENTYEKKPDGNLARSIVKDKTGKVKRDINNNAVLQNDMTVTQVIKNIVKSPLSLADVRNSDNITGMIDKFGLAKGTTADEAIIALDLIKEALSNGTKYDEFIGESKDFESRKSDLRYISEDIKLADLSKDENKLYSRFKKGTINKKQFDKEMAKLRGASFNSNQGNGNGNNKPSKNDYKSVSHTEAIITADKNDKFLKTANHNFGYIDTLRQEYNESGTGHEITPDEKRRANISDLHNSKLLTDKEYKSIQNEKVSSKLQAKIDKQSKRLVASRVMFSKFLQVNATAGKMAELTNESVAAMRRRGYFMTPDEILPFINEDGDLNSAKLEAHNETFSKAYISDIDKQIRKNKSNSLDIDITDPGKSMSGILDDVFTDPSLVKKLGIGGGSAAGLALGKLINNNTFIKSPKLGYLLGAIGGGIMSMERTQEHLNQTFGPAGGVSDGGYSNREIFTAKLLQRWLPAVGVGGKAASVTMKMMSKLGPAGKILGPAAALTVGGALAFMTPKLLDVAKEKMFNDDPSDKGMFKKLGNTLRNLPMVNDFFAPKDGRDDATVFKDTVSKHLQDTNDEIDKLRNKKKKTEDEETELKRLEGYRDSLMQVDKTNIAISKIEDNDLKEKEFNKLYNNDSFVTPNEKLRQKFQDNKNKRERKNEFGDASKAKLKYKSYDATTEDYAKSEVARMENMDISKLSEKEKTRYNALKRIADGNSVSDEISERISDYLDSNKEAVAAVAESLLEDESIVSMVGPSALRGSIDANGKIIKGLKDIDNKEDFDIWLSQQDPDAQEFMKDYLNKRQDLYAIRSDLRGLAEIKITANKPTLSPVEKNKAIENEINQALLGKANIGKYIKGVAGKKVHEVQNKFMNMLGEGGTSSDDIIENQVYLDKLESFIGGGKGSTKVNSIIKMKDLNSYKFKNGSKLSIAGCSIVALNNALNHLSLGGVSIEYLLGVANQYLTSDGGVTSNFFKAISDEIDLMFKTFNSIDNTFSNDILAKFKPTSSKAVILMLRNSQGGGSHYVNLTSINSKKALIDDPEQKGITDVSTSTLVASLLEIIVLEKRHTTSKLTEGNYEHAITDASGKSKLKDISSTLGKAATSIMFPSIKFKKGSSGTPGNLPSKSGSGTKEDNIVNVRILEDYTLPLKVTDGEVAKDLIRHLKSTSNSDDTNKAIKNVERLKKKKSMTNEFIDAQEQQDDIKRTADAVEGISTGKGGAGTGDSPGSRISEKVGSGIFKTLMKIGSIIPAMLSFFTIKGGIGSLLDIFNKQDVEDLGDGGESHSSDRSGSFGDARRMFRMGAKGIKTAFKMFKLPGTLGAKAGKGIFGSGKKLFGLASDIAMNKTTIKEVAKDTSKKNISKLGKVLAGKGDDLAKLIVKLPDVFKGTFGEILERIISKAPLFIRGPVDTFIKTPTGKKGIARISKLIFGIVKGFTKSSGKLLAKATRNATPGVGIVMAIIQAGWSFYEGFVKTKYWVNREVGMLEVSTRLFVGLAKAMWDCLPELLAGLCAMIPGAGTVASIVVTAATMYLQSNYGGFEQFLLDLGLREVSKDYFNSRGEQIDKKTAELLRSQDEEVTEKDHVKEARSVMQKVLGLGKPKEEGPKNKPLDGNDPYVSNYIQGKSNTNRSVELRTPLYSEEDIVKGPSIPSPYDIDVESIENEIKLKGKMSYNEPLNNSDDRVIVSAFGPRKLPGQKERPHNGIDFRAKRGEHVMSTNGGVVMWSGYQNGAGNMVSVKHDDGTKSYYMHLDKIADDVKVNSVIKAGQHIGNVGNTGGNFAPHLHYGLKNKRQQWIDPMLQMGLNPNKLKVSNSPENTNWKSRNPKYVDKYNDAIRKMAEKKVKQKNNTLTEKGGKENPYTKDDQYVNEKASHIGNDNKVKRANGSYSSGLSNSVLAIKVAGLEKQLINSNNELTKSMNMMAALLSRIVDNTDVSSNNNIEHAMMLSK